MFDNVEEKLKGFAKFNFVVVIIFAVVGLFVLMSGLKYADDGEILLTILLFAIIIYSLFAMCWFMYAFAEVTESVKATNRALQLTFEQNIVAAEEKQKEDAEAMQEKRFDDYWEAHAEEAATLLAKREEAQNALASLSDHATKERAMLQHTIDMINKELTKDR